jgi:hypothetical protein
MDTVAIERCMNGSCKNNQTAVEERPQAAGAPDPLACRQRMRQRARMV